MSKKTDTIEIQTSSIAFLQFDRRELVYVYCVLNHDLFSVYPWEYTVMKFAANLNLKEHQFFLLTL